jgi:hypothetical protein
MQTSIILFAIAGFCLCSLLMTKKEDKALGKRLASPDRDDRFVTIAQRIGRVITTDDIIACSSLIMLYHATYNDQDDYDMLCDLLEIRCEKLAINKK